MRKKSTKIFTVYEMLLGWSRLPQFTRYDVQHESGTKRSLFGRNRSVSLVIFFQALPLHSSNLIAPQHLYCN